MGDRQPISFRRFVISFHLTAKKRIQSGLALLIFFL